jgi:hypothetical protein
VRYTGVLISHGRKRRRLAVIINGNWSPTHTVPTCNVTICAEGERCRELHALPQCYTGSQHGILSAYNCMSTVCLQQTGLQQTGLQQTGLWSTVDRSTVDRSTVDRSAVDRSAVAGLQ